MSEIVEERKEEEDDDPASVEIVVESGDPEGNLELKRKER